ncbi:FabD/lysophospholipase-like protein [Aureobasidium subglaciale]|nr:FabD/lysophospholipase-like protein [Aureobasidium subglaciale]KAI5228148.1 FabD/lysophospholipase-like protein [Aureobasidium subglaciale]KAI5231380.1 FabD/lysophospholipase-like protein [Aureobasidium subglaciale]KAI5265552.1 FabD/lysophospholipase-like protein [Aureobasidium subglaciale]
MFKDFFNLHWPCSFSDRASRSCIGTKLSHGAEHRAADGNDIGQGQYVSSGTVEADVSDWVSFIKTELNICEDEYCEALDEEPREKSSRRIASDLHLEQMNDFFTDLGAAVSFISHKSCFACLVRLPQHPLPCGHVLCNSCVQDSGKKGHGKIRLNYCPLHIHTSFRPSWEMPDRSEHAGIRVLCLDGGGMRGIIELEILRVIEKALGGNIRIQTFFDLIVGTSTGGINALALGVKQWSVAHCIAVFEKFCDQAFTEREFRGVWGLEQAAFLNHGSKYKAKPLHSVLQKTLGSGQLFGGSESLSASRTNVAVTATSADGKGAMVIANYNRPHNAAESQVFVRPENHREELEVWEAAAATSAAPFYFKPYTQPKTGVSYLDGGLYHNNPVHVANRERKLLWPDLASKHPDLLLSIGTGRNLPEAPADVPERRSFSKKSEEMSKPSPRKSGGLRRTLDTFGALYQRFDNILDAEQTWIEFEADVVGQATDLPSPYLRFNLDLKRKLPSFDAKDKFEELRKDVRQRLRDPDVVKMTQEIACALVASSFYFKLARTISHRAGNFTCTGYICCKFEEGSSKLKALGKFLSEQSSKTFEPHFVIQEESTCIPDRALKIKLTEKILSRLTIYGMLRIPHVDIDVSDAMASTTATLVLDGGCREISGWWFPANAGARDAPGTDNKSPDQPFYLNHGTYRTPFSSDV